MGRCSNCGVGAYLAAVACRRVRTAAVVHIQCAAPVRIRCSIGDAPRGAAGNHCVILTDWIGLGSFRCRVRSSPSVRMFTFAFVRVFFAAITRSSDHKRRATGGRRHPHHKKRKYASGRAPAATKLGQKRIHLVRGRGGNTKFRALRLEEGNFSWGSEGTLVAAGDYQSKQHMQHVLMRRVVFTVSFQVLDTYSPLFVCVQSSPARRVSSVSCTMPPTTSWCAPTPW